MQKTKWFSEKALQMSKKRKDMKGKGEKERYTHLNAESKEQQAEIKKPSSVTNAKKQKKTKEWERLEISQDNQRYQGNISCKDGHNKDRNDRDLREAEDIKKRWQEYTEEVYKRDLHDSDNHEV